jgi:hypothetical protein
MAIPLTVMQNAYRQCKAVKNNNMRMDVHHMDVYHRFSVGSSVVTFHLGMSTITMTIYIGDTWTEYTADRS